MNGKFRKFSYDMKDISGNENKLGCKLDNTNISVLSNHIDNNNNINIINNNTNNNLRYLICFNNCKFVILLFLISFN